jgi:nicotinate-nucleotide pyrophosphorylase (carboxylating)
LDALIETALAEDRTDEDITTTCLIPAGLYGRAELLAKSDGILAGGEVSRRVFQKVDASLEVEILVADGSRVRPGEVLMTVTGPVHGILTAERTALNFLQRLSGIATLTARYVAETEGYDVKVTDTRKTTPGLRALEKYAVRMGGGHNHRPHLAGAILIKDNHLGALRSLGMDLREIVTRAREKAPDDMTVEVEITNLEEALAAAESGADVVMLDNMSPEAMRRAVSWLPDDISIEASGGINLTNIRAAAACGVDIISIGALTHSPAALDISLELVPASLERR